jgi:hypothetical protein
MSREERKISSGSIDEEWFEIQPRIYRKGKEEENGFFSPLTTRREMGGPLWYIIFVV